MSNKKPNIFSGKGYYIALILCAAAIGITGYVYYDRAEEVSLSLQEAPVAATGDGATQPSTRAAEPTEGSTAATEPTKGRLTTCAPVEGTTVAEYAMEVLSYNETTRDWRVHNGVDIAADAGTAVKAAAAGEVYTVYTDEQMGTTVVIRHEGGYTTKYASLSEDVAVNPGDTVSMGQKIGAVGSTALMESALGDHVHFSVTKNDQPMDRKDFLALD